MRLIIGFIAIFLTPTVYLLSGNGSELKSVSFSYWTPARDIFVGSLIVVGFFLSAYNGTGNGRDWEYYLSKFACVFAICIAIFPTSGGYGQDTFSWVNTIAGLIGLTPNEIHIAASALYFACFISLIWFFSLRAKKKNNPGRAFFYRAVCILMVVGIALFKTLGGVFEWRDTSFWIEIWGLTLFGIAWLRAGFYKNNPPGDNQ